MGKYPDLSIQQEFNLINLVQSNSYNTGPAIEEIVERYRPLIKSVAFKLSFSYRMELDKGEDLEQEGFLGLLEAANRFDFSKKIQFSTYADSYIRGRMRHFIRSEKKQMRFDSTEDQNLSDIESKSKLIDSKSYPEDEIDRFHRFSYLSALRKKLDPIMQRSLTTRQFEVMRLHFWEDGSLSEVAAILNISPAAVSKLLKVSLGKLRCELLLLGEVAAFN